MTIKPIALLPGAGAAAATQHPLLDFLHTRRNAIAQFGAGLAQGHNLSEGLAYGTQGAVQGRAVDDAYATSQKAEAERLSQINQTTQWLKTNYPQFADLPPAQGFQLATQLIGQQQKQTAQQEPNSVQEFQFAQQNGFNGTYAEWMQTGRNGAAGPQIGLQPQWGLDAKGNHVLGQLSTDGRFVPTALPDGMTAIDPAQMTGDKKTATVDSATAANARTALPGAEQAYTITQQTLQQLASPAGQAGQQEQFGSTAFIPNQMTWTRPGSPKAVFNTIVDQLSGQAFLQIRNALKGAGQVTDFEGTKGELAISRMKAAAEKGDSDSFNQAVVDFQTAIDNGMRLLREQAQGSYSEGQPAVAGQQPSIDELLKKYQ